MSEWMIMLSLLVVLITIAGIMLTVKVAYDTKRKGVDDDAVPQSSRNHFLMRNPVLTAYGVATVIMGAVFLYWLLRMS